MLHLFSEPGIFTKYKVTSTGCHWETSIYEGLKPLFEQNKKPSDRRTAPNAFLSVEKDLQVRYPTMHRPSYSLNSTLLWRPICRTRGHRPASRCLLDRDTRRLSSLSL